MQYRSRTTGAPVPTPGDRHGLPAAESPSGRPKDNESLIRTLFYYSPEEIAKIRDFERREREWKLFIADDSYDNDDESEDEGADVRAAYAAVRERLRDASEATQPLGERGGLNWSDEDEDDEGDLVGEAQARFRSWNENASKATSHEDDQDPPAEQISANATPQAQEDSSSSTITNTAAGDAIDPTAVAPANEQEVPSGTIVRDLANGDTALPQVPPTPRLEELDHVPKVEKRRSQSPPEREGSSGRVRLMETIAEERVEGYGTESESESQTPSEMESEGKEAEEQ